MLEPLTAADLSALAGIAHGFFTRRGGVSQGTYASLNCGVGSDDDPAAVGENRARVAQFLSARSLVTAHQIHSATAVVVEKPWDASERPRADAMVTAQRGVALGVLTADCAPVLFADGSAGVIGAAHAGWRGAIGGVLEATIAAMEELGARRQHIRAAVGPCIGQSAYEVGCDFETSFRERDPESGRFFVRRASDARPRFDLAGYVAHRLARARVATASGTSPCTYFQADDFFSYRRSQGRKEGDYGRQISAIVLT